MDWEWMDMHRKLQFAPSMGGPVDPLNVFVKVCSEPCTMCSEQVSSEQ